MIYDRIFIDLEQYVDLAEFDKLRPEISKGIATASHLCIDGIQQIPEGTIHPHVQGMLVNPLYEAVSKYNSLPEDDPIKIGGAGLTYNQLTNYLKNAVGAYCAYRLFPVIGEKFTLGETAEHFPNLLQWIISFKTNNIFKSLYSSNLISVEANGIPWEHYDPKEECEQPDENGRPFVPEFIHIKTDCDRPFYIVDPETGERTFMNTRAAYWNERDWHGGLPIPRPTYTLRINGRFSDEFKKKIGIPV
jgi:hypothetical protein